MAFNGSGTYVLPGAALVDGQTVSATEHNAFRNDVATALTTCVTRDGQSPATANLPMGGFKHTGLGAGTARTESVSLGQVQDGKTNWVDGGGTADAITATYSPAITALVDGQLCYVRATAANATTTPTFSPSGLTARTIVMKGGSALVAGSIAGDGHELELRYDLANTRWELLNPNVYAGGTFTGPVNTAYSTVASHATTADIWGAGNTINWTGTATTTAFPDAPQAGARRTLLIESYGAKFTTGLNLRIEGFISGYTYTCYAGMVVEVLALTTTTFKLYVRPYGSVWPLPTLFNTTNVAASTTGYGAFQIVGNQCSGWLQIQQDPTGAPATLTVLGIAIGEGTGSPPASDFANNVNAGGVATQVVDNGAGDITSDATNKRLTLTTYPPTNNNRTWRIKFQFTML